MATLDEIDSQYIMESYIADSGEVDAQVQDVVIKPHQEIHILFSVADLEYSITVPIDGQQEIRFLDNIEQYSITDIRELINEHITVGINQSLDKVRFTSGGRQYKIKDRTDFSNLHNLVTENDYNELKQHIEAHRAYNRNKDSKYGWKCQIKEVEPITETEFNLVIQLTQNNELTIPIEIPNTRDPEESDVVWLINELGQGSPKLIEGEYVSVYPDQEDKPYFRSVDNSGWHITSTDHYQKQDQLRREYKNRNAQKNSQETTDEMVEATTGGIIVIAVTVMFLLGIGLLIFSAAPNSSQYESNSGPVMSIDHEYPDGTLTVLPKDNVQSVIIQSGGNQYEIDNPSSVINIEPESNSNAEYVYTPGQTVTVIATIDEDSGLQRAVNYDTTESKGENIGENDYLV